MKVLVTGSNGMVGKEVVEKLVEKGYEVREFDAKNGKNILNKAQLSASMHKIDYVIHLAAVIENNNKNLWAINVEGTRNVVQEAIKAKVKRIVFLSSTGVYGNNEEEISEETKTNPQNEYEKSKLVGEEILKENFGKIDFCIIRSSLVFGANEYWKKLFELVRKKYPLPCSGKNHFQVIYAKDLANAIVMVMEKGTNGEIYLVAGEKGKTLNDFYKAVQKSFGMKERIVHIPSFVAVIFGKIFGKKILSYENIRHLSKNRNYNTSKIQKLGWKPQYSMEEAIKEVHKKLY